MPPHEGFGRRPGRDREQAPAQQPTRLDELAALIQTVVVQNRRILASIARIERGATLGGQPNGDLLMALNQSTKDAIAATSELRSLNASIRKALADSLAKQAELNDKLANAIDADDDEAIASVAAEMKAEIEEQRKALPANVNAVVANTPAASIEPDLPVAPDADPSAPAADASAAGAEEGKQG